MAGLLSSLKAAGLTGEDGVRGIARGLRPVTSYGDIGSDDSDSGVSVGRVAGQATAIFVGSGVVSSPPDGQSDYEDARYWLRLTQLVATATGGAVRSVTAVPAGDGATHITGINLPEMAPLGGSQNGVKGCHLLSPGTPVELFVAVDDQGTERYVFARDPSPVRVRVVDATGCGKSLYNGKALRDPTADVVKSVDLSASNAGAEGPAVIIRNLQERNRATTDPWLTAAWNTDQRDFLGQLSRVNADGVAVVDINALVAKLCDPT